MVSKHKPDNLPLPLHNHSVLIADPIVPLTEKVLQNRQCLFAASGSGQAIGNITDCIIHKRDNT
ncbi:hypothetical protein D3C81_2333400 [compost metagenome]